MTSLLYYLPGLTGVPGPAEFERAGLAHALPAGARIATRGCKGPDGASGVLAARLPDGASASLAYEPAAQRWQKCDQGRFWIGCPREQTPGPDELLRADAVGGEPVTLADGRAWRVPIIHPLLSAPVLPRMLALNEAGELVGQTHPRYQAIAQDAERVWQMWRRHAGDASAGGEDLAFGELFRIAAEALGLNYHVGRWEVSFLGLLDDAVMMSVLRQVIDVPAVLEVSRAQAAAKKNEAPPTPAGSATASGSPDGCPATNPPSPI